MQNLASISNESWAIQVREKYKDGENFLKLFNPSKQSEYAANELKCFSTEKAPCLTRLAKSFGANIAEVWLEIQLKDLSEFSGCKEKLSNAQFEAIAKTIITNYGYLKVTELMVFFQKFKAGEYGYFYGSVDGLKITTALNQFLDYRRSMISKAEQAKERIERAAMLERMEEKAISRQEYQKLKLND